MEIRIGSRKSILAQIQAFEVGDRIKQKFPDAKIKFLFRESLGDVNQTASLTSFDSRGVFTEDFYGLLVNKEIDFAIHSWKDLPIAERELTTIGATIDRADCRDVLLIKKSSINQETKPVSLSILSSSPRREYNIGEFLSWAIPFKTKPMFVSVRGNIETRLRKLFESTNDGLVVAKAALDRLLVEKYPEAKASQKTVREYVDQCLPIIIPLTACPAAPAQGALAIEVLKQRPDLTPILKAINDQEVFSCVELERSILAEYGGGCHQKIGATVLARPYGKVTFLRGLTTNGTALNKVTLSRNNKAQPKAANANSIWPTKNKKIDLFARKSLKVHMPDTHQGLWISKSEALPKDWKVPLETPIWVSGLKTWRDLADRGVWVLGSSESLGEDESLNMELLLPKVKTWTKLSHEDSPEENFMKRIATYKLESKEKFPLLSNITHCYWKSGSLFKAALASNPQLKNCWHGCGPGNTYKIITKILGDAEKVNVYLNYDDFIAEILG
ncbi:MAG: hydroxymethylbilane synthase [bacterium]|nr:hydroxymethylbilane synthase [bacterium]